MTKHSFIAIALGAGLAMTPVMFGAPQQDRPQEQQAQREAPNRNNFHFSQQAQTKLREHYQQNFRNGDRINAGHRSEVRVGERMPEGWRGRIHAVPEAVLAEIGPIPAGLEVGYFDGYAVLYDPTTGEIVQVLDVY